MKHRLVFISLLLLALFLALAPTAVASNKWYADGVNGSDSNDCKSPQTPCKTIGHAISLASSGDSIMVAAATYTENLAIGFSLKVIGSGAHTTIIDGRGKGTVVTNSGTPVTLSRLTLQNGRTVRGGGGVTNYFDGTLTINNSIITKNVASGPSSTGFGGGISNGGVLTINDSTVSENSTALLGSNSSGGGIYNSGMLTINRSTVSGNTAVSGGGVSNKGTLAVDSSTVVGNTASLTQGGACRSTYGGGIYNGGTLAVNNSTVNGNTSSTLALPFCGLPADGGGIYNVGAGLTISNSTLSSNVAKGHGGAFGGGIYSSGNPILRNSVVADNSAGNCYGSITSDGYNLSSDNTCNFNGKGDMNNTDPVLGTLGNHGGPTQTIPLLTGSPAIDAGNPRGCTDGKGHLLKTDQRGKPRPDKEDKSGCDIGAFERQKD
jgi:hypothetical protein